MPIEQPKVKLQPGFEKVYILRHGAKMYDDIVAVTTDKELADAFNDCNHNYWFGVETKIINSVEDLKEVESRIKVMGPKKVKAKK